MKTDIINIHGMFVIKTGRIFVYQTRNEPVYDEEGVLVDFDDYSFSEEIVDVCTGEHYGFDSLIHLIGTPDDSYIDASFENRLKRGRRSTSNNKVAMRRKQHCEPDELPF